MKIPGTGGRLAVSGGVAALLFLVILLSPVIAGRGGKSTFLQLWPIALYQAIWCFAEGWVVQRFRPLEAGRGFEDRPGFVPLAIGITAAFIAILSVRHSVLFGPAIPGLIPTGFVIGGFGILLRQIAIIQLGPFFRDAIDLRDDHDYVSTGLYACFRHPAEFGFAMAMVGVLLIGSSPVAAILFGVFLIPLILIRITLENRMLRERFGA